MFVCDIEVSCEWARYKIINEMFENTQRQAQLLVKTELVFVPLTIWTDKFYGLCQSNGEKEKDKQNLSPPYTLANASCFLYFAM